LNIHIEGLAGWDGNRTYDEAMTTKPNPYGLDLGSSFGLNNSSTDNRAVETLQRIEELCQGEWWWNTQGHTLYGDRMTTFFSLGAGPDLPQPSLRRVVIDIRVLLVVAFQEPTDALLARISIMDLNAMNDDRWNRTSHHLPS
jgi:hypothetical protein